VCSDRGTDTPDTPLEGTVPAPPFSHGDPESFPSFDWFAQSHGMRNELATLEEIRVFQRNTSQALKVRKYPISCPFFWKQESQ
jgi:hypothetical protein